MILQSEETQDQPVSLAQQDTTEKFSISPQVKAQVLATSLAPGRYTTIHDQGLPYPLLVSSRLNYFIIFEEMILGAGSFGKVYLGENLKTGQKVAIKSQNLLRDDQYTQEAIKEGQALKLCHRLIDQFFHEESGLLYLISPFYPGCDLNQLLEQFQNPYEISALLDKVDVAIAALECVENFHQQGFLHRDLKSENIIWDKKTQSCQLVDLAKVVAMDGDQQYRSDCPEGTLRYMAPELCQETAKFSKKSELYAMGMVLFQLFADKNYRLNDMAIMADFVKRQPTEGVSAVLQQQVPEFFSHETPIHPLLDPIKNIVLQLIDCDPNNRPDGASAILQLKQYRQFLLSQLQTADSSLHLKALGTDKQASLLWHATVKLMEKSPIPVKTQKALVDQSYTGITGRYLRAV